MPRRSSRWWRCRCSRRRGSRDAPSPGPSSMRWRMCRGQNMNAAILMLLAALSGAAHADNPVASLLKDADRYRTGQDNLQVETQVQVLNRDGTPDKERRYTV